MIEYYEAVVFGKQKDDDKAVDSDVAPNESDESSLETI